MSRDEQTDVIKKYAKLDSEIKTKESCNIGVGYTTCQDIGFKAVDLFQALQPELSSLKNVSP